MSNAASRFFNAVRDAKTRSTADLVGLFVYYLTVNAEEPAATPSAVRRCFEECDLTPPARIAAYLSEGVSKKPQKYVKVGPGEYRLQRHYREQLSEQLGAQRMEAQTSAELRRLEASLPGGPKKGFLKETIDCFEAGAERATIIMCWILTMDHLYDYISAHKLGEFNAALAKNNDKRVRVTVITNRNDFTELPESKFIEFCRSAGIISNDLRKILDEKLGTRNSCAHPSGITVKRSKVIDFVEDLVTNVVQKFAV